MSSPALFDRKSIKSLPRHRRRGTPKHIGKVVVTIGNEPVKVFPPENISNIIPEKATYLITGGWSGLGLAVTEWLAEKGAKHLVVIGRSGAKTKVAKDALKALTAKGVNVLEGKTDIGNEAAVKAIFAEINAKKMPPIRGVIHSAMVLDDAILPDMTHERFMTAIRPKVMGVVNLHNYTKKEPVDFFTSFSSVSGQYGTTAQCNYAAANLFLDMFSYYRQANGFKGNTLSWGVISEVGFVARNENVNGILAR